MLHEAWNCALISWHVSWSAEKHLINISLDQERSRMIISDSRVVSPAPGKCLITKKIFQISAWKTISIKHRDVPICRTIKLTIFSLQPGFSMASFNCSSASSVTNVYKNENFIKSLFRFPRQHCCDISSNQTSNKMLFLQSAAHIVGYFWSSLHHDHDDWVTWNTGLWNKSLHWTVSGVSLPREPYLHDWIHLHHGGSHCGEVPGGPQASLLQPDHQECLHASSPTPQVLPHHLCPRCCLQYSQVSGGSSVVWWGWSTIQLPIRSPLQLSIQRCLSLLGATHLPRDHPLRSHLQS